MTVFSIADRITGWIDRELETASTLAGDEFGRHVTMALQLTSQGESVIWLILITLRSPYLAEQPIGCTGKLPGNIPAEAAVRQSVRNSVEKLRAEFDRKQAAGFPKGNGHDAAGLPPGLLGRKLG